MVYELLKTAHVLAVVLWVGGMLFVHFFLRPALGSLEPPQRLRLMHDVLGRFFGAVTVAVAVVLASGAAMIDEVARQAAATGGQLVMPLAWTLMTVLGLVMAVIYGVIRLRFYPALQRALAAAEPAAAAAALAHIRRWVTVNLVLGVAVIGAAVGRLQLGA